MLVQDDSRWAHLSIGGDVTLAKAGCLLVCICMVNHLLDNPLNPDVLVSQLKAVQGLTESGDLLWASLKYTGSLVWLCMDGSVALEEFVLVEYARPNDSSHFVLEYKGEELDPKPGTERFGVRTRRRFALI